MKRSFASLLVLVALSTSGCTVNLSKSESADIVKNVCTSDADCGDGACWSASPACVAHEGAFSSLLVEITPPVGTLNADIGGISFRQIEPNLSRSNEQHDLDIDGVSTVHGYIKSTCPLEVTLTPEEQSYGLAVASYVAHTAGVAARAANDPTSPCPQETASDATQEFVLNVPPGTFDVYMRPASNSGKEADAGSGADCQAAPQLFRGVVKATSGVSCVGLTAHQTQTLDVQIPWPAAGPTLDGWRVDILHPVTGQVLSEATTPLRGGPSTVDGRTAYDLSVRYSPIVADSTTKAGQELLRLSPRTPADGPVLQFSLVPLVAASPVNANRVLKAVLPDNLSPLPTPVHADGWAWRADAYGRNAEVGVAGSVTFAASQLNGVPDGIFASFSTSTMVESDGRLEVDLIPGNYRVGILPRTDGSSSPLAAQELTWSVGALDSLQGGHTLLVKNASSITGTAISSFGVGVAGAAVQALPATVGTRRCEGLDASACAAQPLGVLEQALAQAAYVPRPATGVTGRDGVFALAGVDCGDCSPKGTDAVFDLAVQPANGTRLPWTLHTGIAVGGAPYDLGKLRATLPIIQRGSVQVPHKGANPTPLPGALIRAYLLRDATGAPVFNPTGLPSCSSGTYSGAETTTGCIRSALQVAETHADESGKYELVLPSGLDETPQ